MSVVTSASRTAAARARLFIEMAAQCPAEHRVEFEAFVEAGIAFGRAAIHRLQTKYRGHPKWLPWWKALATNLSVDFFRRERDRLLKEAPPKIGQRGFVRSVGGSDHGYTPTRADEFYFLESPAVSATESLLRHLEEIERLIAEAEVLFS